MKLFLDFTFVGGIVLILIIIGLLIKSKKKQLSKQILIVFFGFLMSVSIFFYANLHGINWLSYLTFIPNDLTAVILGPLLYLYIKSMFLEEKGLVKNTLIHFIPVAFYLLSIAFPTLVYSIFKIDALSYVFSENISFIFRIEDVYLITYLILSLQLLSKYRRVIKVKYSNLSEYDYSWIKTMLYGALFIVSADLVAKLYETFFDGFIWYQEYLIIIAMIILVSFLGYFGVNQSNILLPDFVLVGNGNENKEHVKINTFPEAYQKEFVDIKNLLQVVLVEKKPFLDEDLTLGKLAGQLSTTDKKLSMFLNQHMNTTFYDFINKHRVEAVIDKMKLNTFENYSLFGIATECGFKSRTSFNRVFKKETGISPSAYKARLS